MLLEYEKLTDSIIDAIKRDDSEEVDALLDKRGMLLKTIEESGNIESFKESYRVSKAYKKDLDIEFMLNELKSSLLKEIDDFNKFKGGNMAYINTLKDNMQLFVAKV